MLIRWRYNSFADEMIVLFHEVVLELCSVVNKCWEIVACRIPDNVIYTGTSKYCVNGVTFSPPVYVQRQEAVYKVMNDFISRLPIKKIVDFGCGGFEYFKIFKGLSGVQEVLEIDVNEELLEREHCRVAPTAGDFLVHRDVDLKVKVFAGSISDLDTRVLGTDAVVCVEVLEHLYPETLESVPYTIFGFIKPQLAVFTTPNRDINILFDLQTPFRDADHKFEWSRVQFKCWGDNIVERYPDYKVMFYGIARGPEGTESVGCCSQMAVFVRKSSLLKDTVPSELEHTGEQLIYRLIAEYNYPAYRDIEQEDKCILDKIWTVIRDMDLSAEEHSSDFCLPLSFLHSKLRSNTHSLSELKNILENAKWKLKLCSGDIYVFPFYEDSDSDSLTEGDDECMNIPVAEYTEGHESVWEQCTLEEEQWDTELKNV